MTDKELSERLEKVIGAPLEGQQYRDLLIRLVNKTGNIIHAIENKKIYIANPSAWEAYSDEGSEHLRDILTAAEGINSTTSATESLDDDRSSGAV